jgi:signal transduction histidine kinase
VSVARLAASLACIVTLLVVGAVAADAPATKHILLLHQAGGPGPFRGKFDVAFMQTIRSAASAPIDLYEEDIETQRLGGPQQSQLARDYLKSKYLGRTIDVIVAPGTAPLAFARQNRALFGNPPIVAIATPAGLVSGSSDDVTGLQGGYWISGTIDLALALLPGTQRVVVVDGARESNDELQAEVERQFRTQYSRLALVYLRNRPLSAVLSRITTIPDRSIVLLLKQTIRSDVQDVDQLEALARILAASAVPVFSQLEDLVGHGVVGGSIWRFEEDARRMAEMARQIANGTSVREIAPGRSTYATLVDWRQLQRWRIPASRVPAGTVVLYRPQAFFELYRWYVIGGLVVFTAQLTLIVGLLVQRVRRRRAEEEMRASQERLEQAQERNAAMLRAVPDLMFVVTRDGTYLDYHAKDPKQLFVPPSAFLGRTVRDVMPPDLAEVFMEAIERAYQSDNPVVIEYDLPLGETRHFESRIVRAGADRVLSMVRDVTESKRAMELNRDLAGRLIVSQEAERQRIARELHDDLSQKIALLSIELDQLAPAFAMDGLGFAKLREQMTEIASDVHDLSHELHPSKLQILGLPSAMKSLCRDISRQRGVDVVFTHGAIPTKVDPKVSLCLYRIAQEALHNVARHSHAREAEVNLTCSDNCVVLQIADSGVGFDARVHHDGLGLVSMRERVTLLRGHLAIHTAPGSGTRIGVRIPLDQRGSDSASPTLKSA